MKIYDISMTVHKNMAVYKNVEEKRPRITAYKKMPKDSINETVITMNVHTGTHIDAPYHIYESGAGIDTIDLAQLVRPCKVLDLTHVSGGITKEPLLAKNIEAGSFLLFKTKNSFSEEFQGDFVYLEESGAQYLKDMNIKGVGIDALGIERNQPGHETHKTLMSSGIIILEGLRLKDINEGSYLLCALPIKIKGADGSPARVVLIT